MIRQTLTIAALAAVLATPAFAQTNTPMNNTNAPSSMSGSGSTSAMTTDAAKPGMFVQQQQATEWRTSKLVGTDVYGSDNSKMATSATS